jgi:hypothetical protein
MPAGSLCCESRSSESWRAHCGFRKLKPVHTVGWLGDRLSALKVARTVAAHKVEVTPLSAFTLKTSVPQGLLLGFGAGG